MRLKTRWIAFCLTAGTLTGAAGAWAQTNEATHKLSDIVVQPERNLLLNPADESAALDVARTDLSMSDLKTIKPATASDALKAAPGIHTETRGRKYKQFHSFRGQIYPYPDVVVDGIWQRDAKELFYVYPGTAIERVEISRSSSTLFSGLADVVGVINIVPHRPRLDPATPRIFEAGAEAGSFGTARLYGIREFRPSASLGAIVGGQYYRTDGRSGRNAAEEISSAFGTFVWQSDPDHRIQLGTWFLHGFRELEMPDPDGPAQNNLKNRKERYDPLTYSHINLRGFHRWSERSSSDWKVFYSDRQARYIRRKINPAGPGPGNADEDEDDREYGAQIVQAISPTPDNTVRLGVFVHRWTAPNGKQSYVGSRQDIGSYAFVLADEQKIGDWTLDAGLRYARSYFYDYSGPAFDITGQSTRTQAVEDEWDEPVLSGTLGATLALDDRNKLSAHGGMGERRPGPGAVREDGSSPDTERRATADIGWTRSWGADNSGRMKLGGFGVWRTDAITRINKTGTDQAGNEFYFSGNQDMRQYGAELDTRSPRFWNDRLVWMLGLTWMQSETKANGSYEDYKEVPTLVASGGLRMDTGVWDAALLAKHVDQYENFRFAQGNAYHDLGDYWDLSLSGGVRVGRERNVRIYGIVDNLLDDDYSTVVGWTDPGIRFRAGVEASF